MLGPHLIAMLRGPRWLREGLAITVAAQIGVAPVLIPVFGSIPVASLPANLLAVPLAAPLTMWGLLSGLVGSVLEPWWPGLAAALQVPTGALAGMLLRIAATFAALRAGDRRAGSLGPRRARGTPGGDATAAQPPSTGGGTRSATGCMTPLRTPSPGPASCADSGLSECRSINEVRFKMAVFNGAFPILPGKLDEGRAFAPSTTHGSAGT